MIQAQVVIVGAGPAGLSAALFLVSRGISVVVLEAEDVLPKDMRASTFHPPTLDMLDIDGLARRLVETGHKAPQWQYLRLDTMDAAVFDLGILANRTRHPFRLQCEQFRLTGLIVEQLRGHPQFAIEFGARVVEFSQDDRGVRAVARRGDDMLDVRAQFLVGADGSKSYVRKALGLELAGDTYPTTSITVVVDFPFERYLPNMLHVNYVWTANDHYSLMRVGGCWRTGFSPTPGQGVAEALTADNVEQHLQRILPCPQPYRVVHVGAYTIHKRLAATFKRGRVLLAGDAAHLNSPSGGMGMNSGIHDARHLATALYATITDGDDEALDRYAAARRTVAAEHVQTQSDRNHRRHRERNPAKREEIWRNLKSITADPARMRMFLLESSMIAALDRFGADVR